MCLLLSLSTLTHSTHLTSSNLTFSFAWQLPQRLFFLFSFLFVPCLFFLFSSLSLIFAILFPRPQFSCVNLIFCPLRVTRMPPSIHDKTMDFGIWSRDPAERSRRLEKILRLEYVTGLINSEWTIQKCWFSHYKYIERIASKRKIEGNWVRWLTSSELGQLCLGLFFLQNRGMEVGVHICMECMKKEQGRKRKRGRKRKEERGKRKKWNYAKKGTK